MNKKFKQQLLIGYKSYYKAIIFIFKNNLFWYFAIPFVLNIIFLFGGLGATIKFIKITNQAFKSWINFDTKNFFGHEYLNEFFFVIIGVLITVLFFIAFMYLSGHIIMIIFSPLLSFLSEKVDNIITGNDFHFEWKPFFSDILRGIFISTRNMVIEIAVVIIMLIVSFIPIIGWFTPVVLFLVSSYFYGFSFIDYTNERKGLSVSESVKYVRKNKGIAYSNGSVFSLFLLVPFCGASIAAFVSVISTVAATLAVIEVDKNEELIINNQ